jgi:hypothetical protein
MKTNAHIIYEDKRGTLVPGVTTVLNILSKPFLIKWANNLGQRGIDSSKYTDEAALCGTLAHYLIMCHFKGVSPDTSDYSANQAQQAKNSLLSFRRWEKSHSVKPILVEKSLVSDTFGYGGTIDFYGKIDGKPTLVDFKTGKDIYPEMRYQVAAYYQLLREHRYEVSETRILCIGRGEDDGFKEQEMGNLEREWKIFAHCLAIYKLQRK